MREIKFRAWDKYSNPNKMVYPNDGDFIGWHAPSNWKDCYDVMQYTGLKDSKGVEIYEGDLVIRTGTFELHGKPPNKVRLPSLNLPMKVFFHEGQYKIKKAKDSTNHHLNGLVIRMAGIEVIGNIYQNPSLLPTTEDRDDLKSVDFGGGRK